MERISEYVPDVGDYIAPICWEQYLRLEDPPGMRLEYDDGVLLMSPTGRLVHDALRDILAFWLRQFEEEDPERCIVMFESSFFMPPGKRDFRPDVAVVLDERKDEPLDPEGWMHQAPNIAVEVLSPSTKRRDLGLKAKRYFEQGAWEYWLFDPEARTARFLHRGEAGWMDAQVENGRYTTPHLPGFELDLERLWKRLDVKLRVGKEPARKKPQ